MSPHDKIKYPSHVIMVEVYEKNVQRSQLGVVSMDCPLIKRQVLLYKSYCISWLHIDHRLSKLILLDVQIYSHIKLYNIMMPNLLQKSWKWPAPVKWSWTVHEWFLNSSCAVHEHLFMNSSWTIHKHDMAKFMKLVRFMHLEFISLSSWTCEFMNLWVHELFMIYSSWIVHELLVHDLFMNNF